MLRKITVGALAVLIIIMLVPLFSIGASAAPYREIRIVPDDVSIIEGVWFDSEPFHRVGTDGNRDARPDHQVATEFRDSQISDANIGWIAAGMWVQYTVVVQADGHYRFEACLASEANPVGNVIVSLNDVEIGTSASEDSLGWGEFDMYFVGDVEMTAGTHVIRVEFTGGTNFAGLRVTPLVDGQPIWTPREYRIGGTGAVVIRAIDFDAEPYGKAGTDGAQAIRRDHNVRTEFGTGYSPPEYADWGGNIGWIDAGDWVQYTVNVTRAGRFNVQAWLASDSADRGGVTVSVGDSSATSPAPTASTGWQDYHLIDVGEIDIAETGEQAIRVEFGGGVNFAALVVTRTGNIPQEEDPAQPAEAGGDEAAGEDAPAGGDDAETPAATQAPAGGDDDGNNMILFIVLAIVAVVIIAVIIIFAAKKKKEA